MCLPLWSAFICHSPISILACDLFRCGSGCVTSFLASLLQHLARGDQQRILFPPLYFALDKQLAALEATRETLRRNCPGAALECIGGDLFRALKGRFRLPSKAGNKESAADEGSVKAKKALCEEGPFDLILFNPVRPPLNRQKRTLSRALGGSTGGILREQMQSNRVMGYYGQLLSSESCCQCHSLCLLNCTGRSPMFPGALGLQ